ncbi:hypothetical protein RJ640_030814 [Escallonia rubra]|uniref:AAA-ATPase n=1 Tax=Escallonia rubra TaxID=112253 RepID=A0AA88QGE5_9ASTE|nr:hypothetical protein RJ640_030814 [Escallonia rubra]
MPSAAAVLSAYTAFVASAMLIRTVLNEVRNMINHFIPKRLQEKIISKLEGLLGNLSPQMTFIIDEQSGLTIDQVYKASEIYLTTRITPAVQRLKVSKAPRDKNFSVTINKGEKVVDTFKGVEVIWEMVCVENKRQKYDGTSEHRSFELTFNKKDMDLVMTSYLPHVMEKSKAIKEENNVAKLFGDRNDGLYYSSSINFEHPSTFDTLAMDPILKKELIDDLDRFVKRKDYYKRVGKAWKRGYLLYGPPGTDLQNLKKNSDLRRVLISIENRSILVIEDIDCSIELQNRQVVGDKDKENVGQLTLSGLLNFIDGLWSSCGDERIIVFTTNHKDKLDPALLRPGRMDMHIHMSYCTPPAFKFLASNYLGIDTHGTFGDIEELISEVEVTPAEIAEELMKSEEADVSLGGVLKFLRAKMERMEVKLTLSGLLNFIDGLWSSCGDEKIIVFTTNHKDKLDPALLRPGRMDMHIHMPYCTPPAFKSLASIYLGIDTHGTFGDIEKLISEVEVSPAEIAEELMKSEQADVCLGGVLKSLRAKKMERTEVKVEGHDVEI